TAGTRRSRPGTRRPRPTPQTGRGSAPSSLKATSPPTRPPSTASPQATGQPPRRSPMGHENDTDALSPSPPEPSTQTTSLTPGALSHSSRVSWVGVGGAGSRGRDG